MPSSTSSSDPGGEPAVTQPEARTADPVIHRPIPAMRWPAAALIGARGCSWSPWAGGRRSGARSSSCPPTAIHDGQWAEAPARLDRSEPNATAFIGSSRTLFDIDLDVLAEETGHACRAAGARGLESAARSSPTSRTTKISAACSWSVSRRRCVLMPGHRCPRGNGAGDDTTTRPRPSGWAEAVVPARAHVRVLQLRHPSCSRYWTGRPGGRCATGSRASRRRYGSCREHAARPRRRTCGTGWRTIPRTTRSSPAPGRRSSRTCLPHRREDVAQAAFEELLETVAARRRGDPGPRRRGRVHSAAVERLVPRVRASGHAPGEGLGADHWIRRRRRRPLRGLPGTVGREDPRVVTHQLARQGRGGRGPSSVY